MLFRTRTLAVLFVVPFLTQCGPGPAPAANAVTGPFDNRGNYIEDWVDQPDKWYKPSTPSERSRSKPKPQIAKNEPTPPPEIAVVQPRPERTERPDPVVVKPKPKPKPKPKVVKYTVKKGDSLGRIASRNGVSLSALRRANGISGDLIRPGQVLTIPK